jgi:hypothetical protein
MKHGRLLIVVAFSTAIGAASGCKDQEVRNYLQYGLSPWLLKVDSAVCQIEVQTQGLDPNMRLCPNGPGGPDRVHVPTYPPAP